MRISEKGIDIIKKFESYKDKAYLCEAGVWTIGFGTTVKFGRVKVKEGDTCTVDEANQWLRYDIGVSESSVSNLIKPILSQNQYDAIISFVYNIGIGAFSRSTLLKKLNINPNDDTIKNEFIRWNRAGGKVSVGLIKRRKLESELYFS